MRFQKSLFAATLGALLLAGTAPSMAESTYGYNAAGTGPVTATARVQINVNVPLLILLRVGAAGAGPEVVNITGTLAGGIPGGPATVANGSNLPSTWDGTAPIFGAGTATTVTAYAWTNAPANGALTCAVTTPFAATSGLTGTSVAVTSTTVSGTGLPHPGATTACTGASTPIARNTLLSSTWAYSVTAAILAAAAGGANTETITYTATTL